MSDVDPLWLSNLNRFDRGVARRWLRDVGEARMRRILEGLTSHGGSKPKRVLDPTWVTRVLDVFISRDGLDIGIAAGIVARQLQAEGLLSETTANARRALSEKLSEYQRPTARSIQALMPLAENRLKAGQPLRLDLFPQPSEVRILPTSPRPPAPSQVVPLRLHPPMSAEDLARVRALASFMGAFDNAVLDDLPISAVGRLYAEVEAFLRKATHDMR